jgi:hypothetical protein
MGLRRGGAVLDGRNCRPVAVRRLGSAHVRAPVAPVKAGLAFLPLSASTLIVATQLAPRLLPRVQPRALMVPGFLLAALGMALLTQLTSSSDYLSNVLPCELLLGLGIACVMVPASSLATSGVDLRDAGVAAATLNTAQQVGASLGTALLNTLATSASPAVAAQYAAGLLIMGAAIALVLRRQ